MSYITGVEPSVLTENLACRFLIVVIALHDDTASDIYDAVSFAVRIHDLHFKTRDDMTDGILIIGFDRIQVRNRACLGETVTLDEVNSELVEHLEG